LLQWLYSLLVETVQYLANQLLDVFSMDLDFFENSLPVTADIFNIVIASGWALLLGNLVFQAAKGMMAGLGFEGDDPRELFARTFVFGFCLLASRQICDIGLGLSSSLIDMLMIPDAVDISLPGENVFAVGASWLLVIIIGVVLIWQLVKLFLAVGERYFLVGLLTILAPWAFATGGSRNTADIFKGWARMYATMCFMMALNVIILKLFISAMGHMPSGPECAPWVIFVIAIARVGKKIDSVILRIGLNPSTTGGGGRSLPGMLTYMVARAAVSKAMGAGGKANMPNAGTSAPKGGASDGRAYGGTRGAGTSNASSRFWTRGSNSRGNNASGSSSHTSNTARTSSSSQTDIGARTAGDARQNQAQTQTAQHAQGSAGTQARAGTADATRNTVPSTNTRNTSQHGADQNIHSSATGAAGTARGDTTGGFTTAAYNHADSYTANTSKTHGANGAAVRPGFPNTAKRPIDIFADPPASPHTSQNRAPNGANGSAPFGGAGTVSSVTQQSSARQSSKSAVNVSGDAGKTDTAPRKSRYSAVPPGVYKTSGKHPPGNAGTGGAGTKTDVRQGGASISAQTNTNMNTAQNTERRERYSSMGGIYDGASPGTKGSDVPDRKSVV
jgi:hypothetical protein